MPGFFRLHQTGNNMRKRTAEERRSMFADVQARSRAALKKRRKKNKGMAATLADIKPYSPPEKEYLTAERKPSNMSPGTKNTLKGVFGAIRNRNRQLKEALR